MIRKSLTVVLLSGLICLLGLSSVLAQESWNLSEYEKATGKTIESFSEAPMLRTLVAAGELPPVGERLPEEPLVVEPVEEIGQYGGTLNTFTISDTGWDDANVIRGFGTSFRMSPDLTGLVPNVAKDLQLSEDGKTLTMYLRKGMKWSDGAPLTADDVMFWWEDIVLNEELTPTIYLAFTPGGELWEVEKIDDYTIRFRFAVAQPFVMIDQFAHFGGGEGGKYYPKHYMKKYHATYTSMEELQPRIDEGGFQSWTELFAQKTRLTGWGSYWINTETPTLRPWLLKEKGIDWWLLERNPYYFAVDTAGNQLPYIDQIFNTNVGNAEVYNAKIISGEADFAAMNGSFDNYTLYVESAEEADYRILNWNSGLGAEVTYMPNQTLIGDPVLRKIIQDVRFRRALSLAINREDINESLYHGLAIPRQYTVVPDSRYYEEEFGTAYAQYDPEEGNRLLDEMGLDERDKEGYRLRPDGKRLSLLIEYDEGQTPRGPVSELVKEYWEALGIDVALKLEDKRLRQQRFLSSEIEINVWHGDGMTDVYFPRSAGWIIPDYINSGPFTLWGKWYFTGGEEGEEPPEECKENLKRWETIKTITDEEEIIRLAKEILRSQAENLWVIGTVGGAPVPVIVKNNLRNIPEESIWAWDNLFINPARPAQFFFKE